MKAYTDQRISRGLQKLVQDQGVPIFFHDSTRKDALAYHQAKGFDQIYVIYLGRGETTHQPVLVRNSRTGELAYVWSTLRARDQLARAKEQLAFAFGSKKVHLIRHRKRAPLFEWNEAGKTFSFFSEDKVIIGFANHIERTLADRESWRIEELTSDGTPMRLFTNLKTGRRIVSARNVYGDEMSELMRRLYAKGARRFFMLGSAGALDPSFQIGDIVVPNEYMSAHGKRIQIRNGLKKDLLESAEPVGTIHSDSRHGWVQSILDESVLKTRGLQKAGIQTLDIEGRYFFEFFGKHSDVQGGLAYFISDKPLGELNYEASKGGLPKIHAALDRIVPIIFGHEPSDSVAARCVLQRMREIAR